MTLKMLLGAFSVTAAALLSACDSDQLVSARGVLLEADQEIVDRTGPVGLRLTNLSEYELVFHPCNSVLQYRPGKTWLTVPSGQPPVCQADAPRKLLPGESQPVQLAIPNEAEPGRYRYVLDVLLGGEEEVVLSSEFVLSGATPAG